MRQRVDADAELADGIGLFEQFAIDTTCAQHQRSGEASDAASDDDCLHQLDSTLHFNLAPLAGRGRIALAIRVRGYRSINAHRFRGESPSPQPSPRKGGAREHRACHPAYSAASGFVASAFSSARVFGLPFILM